MIIVNPKDARAMRSAIRVAIEDVLEEVSERRVKDMYRVSIYAKACADYWATNVGSCGWTVKHKQTGQVLDPKSGHLLALMASSPKFRKALRHAEYSFRFFGWALLRKLRNAYGGVVGLEFVYPNLVVQDIDQAGLRGWNVYSDWTHKLKVDYIARDDAVFMTGFDFDNEYNGVSSAEAAFIQCSTEPEMALTILYAFRNMMMPALMIMGGDDNKPTEDEADSVTTWLKRFTRGAKNFGKTFVSPVRWFVERLTPPFKDVDFGPQFSQNRQMIAAAFNLSPSFISIGESHYNEQEGQHEAWQEHFYVPHMDGYGQEISEQLCDLDYPEYVLVPDYTSVLKDDALDRFELGDKRAKASLISLADHQRAQGLAAVNEFEDLFWYEGIGWVPKAEFPAIWRTRLTAPNGPNGQPPLQLPASVEEPPAQDPAPALSAPPLLSAPPKRKTSFRSSIPYVPESVHREMEVAARKLRRGVDFTPALLPAATVAYMRTLIVELGADEDVVLSGAHAHYDRVTAAKAIQATRLEFEGKVEDFLAEAVAGTIDKNRFKQLLRAAVRTACRQAYFDGLDDGGVTTEELDAEEDDWLDAHIKAQTDYVSELADAIFEDGAVTEAEAANKPAMWWNKSIEPAYQHALLSAASNAAFMWLRGSTEEGCPDCSIMDGQVRRLKEYHRRGIVPKSGTLNCNGFQCECALVPTDEPVTRGPWPKLVGPAVAA